MALNVAVQVLTMPGSPSQVSYSLAASFDPKAVVLWAVPLDADGSLAHYSLGVGFGTYRGSVVQSCCVAVRGLDAATSADTARGTDNASLLNLLTSTAGAATVDLEIDLVSMTGGASSEVRLEWVNLHSTAAMRVFMLVLGGSDITDARADDMTLGTASTTQDETVVAGFGKPELLFMGCAGSTAIGNSAASPAFSFGFGKQGEAGRSTGFWQTDGNTASLMAARQRSDRILCALAGVSTDAALGRLDTTVSNWPTDGFRMLFDANPSAALIVPYLAIRTTAQITTGVNTAPTSGGLPVAQNNACGFAPKLGMLFGWNQLADTGIITTDINSDLYGMGIGAYDGATEAWAGITDQDALGTMDANSQQTIAKVLRNYAAAGVSLHAEADGAFSGNDFQLSWNNIDVLARQYQWLALGDAAVAATMSLLYNPPRQASLLYNR